jgi:hypothetical protein
MYMGISGGSTLVGLLLPLGNAVAFGAAGAVAGVAAAAGFAVLRHER